MPGMTADPPSSILGGEELLARVYSAIRACSTAAGSNFANTLFLVAFDEHERLRPRPPPRVPPPDPAAPAGQMKRFSRSGIRIPLAISAYIDPRPVVAGEYRNTSLIRTLRERFSLGPPLTRRDAVAADIAPILTRNTPRAQEDWPEVTAREVPPLPGTLVPMNQPLPPLGQYLLGTAIALDTMNTGHAPDIDPKTATGQQAHDYVIDRQARIWPGRPGVTARRADRALPLSPDSASQARRSGLLPSMQSSTSATRPSRSRHPSRVRARIHAKGEGPARRSSESTVVPQAMLIVEPVIVRA